MKRKSNAIKALVEYILSSDFQQRYEDAGLNYTGIQEIDFSQGTIDGEKYSEIDFIEEVGLRIGEVLEIDEDENRDENRDEDIEEVNDERVVAGDHAEDGIGSEITPPVVSKNDIGFIGGKTPIESFVTPLVSVGTPEPLDESPIFNQLTLPQELNSGAFPGAKLRILLEANIGNVISFSQVMQLTSLESEDKVKKAIANLNLKVFSHTSNKIFTLSETNTRTSSHLVLSDTNDFERIHVEFLNTKKSIIQSQSPVRRIGTRGPRPEVEDFTEESQLKTGAKIQNGMQFIYGEIFQTDTQTLRKLCETNKKWYNFERKSFRGVELSIDEFIMCVFGFSDEGFYYGDFDRDRNKVLSVKASLFRKIDSEGKKYDFTHNTEEALVKFTPREKDDTLKSEKFLRYLQQNSGRVIPKSELLREFTCMTDWQLISIRNKIPDKDAGCIIQIGDRNNFEGYFYGTEAKYIAYKEEQERIAEKRRRDGQVPVVVPKTTGISFSINHSQDEIHLITQNNSDVTLDLKNRSVNTIVLLEEEFALFLYLLKNRGVKMSLTQIGEYFGIDDTQVGNDFQMKFLGLKASMNNKLGKDNSLLHVQKDASNLFINQLTISEVKEYEAFGVKFSISSQFNTVDINGVRQQELGNGKIIEYLSEILGTKGYKKNFSVSYHRELIKTINQVFLDGKHRIHIYADTKSGIAKLEELRDLRQPVRVETGKVSEFEINILSQNHVFNIDHRAFGMTQQGTTLSFGLQRSGNGDVLFSEIEWIIFAYFLYHCGIEKDVKAIMDELCLFDDNTKQSTREFSEFLQSIKRNISEKMTKAGVNDKKYFITWRDEKFMIASHKKNDLTPSQNFQTPQTPESKVGKRILSNGVIIEYSEVDVTLKIKGREIQLGDNKEYNSYIFRFLRRNNERLKLSLGKNGKNPEYRINPINTYYSSLGLPFKINNSEEIYCTEK